MSITLTPLPTTTGTLGSYLTVADAELLAADLPAGLLTAWTAASSSAKAAALAAATLDLDAAGPWQGQKYDGTQALEFPRLAYGDIGTADCSRVGEASCLCSGAVVWDVDASGNAVVPGNVKLAVLYQAESILAGKRAKRVEAQHDGIASHGVGSLNESFAGRVDGLCLRARQLMKRYELRSGRML